MTTAQKDPVLVVLQMSGGNDSLNTVIPFTDPLYRDYRPTVGIPEDKALPITDILGFHPNMGPISDMYKQGNIAIVHGVGYENSPRSHFRSMDIWHTCEPDTLGTQGWLGQEQEEVNSYKRMTTIAPAFVIVYALVMSIIVYDWVMTLEPHWYSTMIGPWFFMGAFWGGIASTALWSLYLRTQDKEFKNHIGLQQRHDIGKLAFAFSVFWTYLFFGQYLVIWYGKLPWEQAWMVRRSDPESWGPYSLLVIVMCFVIPFAGLLGRKPKMKPKLLAFFTSVIVIGLWLERYGMVAPSLWHEGDPIFTIWQPLIGCMFLGLYLGAVRWFLTTFPAMQIWQPMGDPETVEVELAAAE